MRFLSFCFICIYCFSAFSKAGYVDFDQILQKTKDGRSLKKKLEKEFSSRQGQLQKTEKKLQEERQQFESESSLLSDSEKRKRAQKLQIRFVEFQKKLEIFSERTPRVSSQAGGRHCEKNEARFEKNL